MMETPYILQAERIDLRFDGGAPLFRGLNLGLRRGGFIAVVGSSGSGKTTLLKILGGFLRPDAGLVRLDGEPLKEPSPRGVMVFQEFDQLFPWKTVYANVAFPLRVRRGGRKGQVQAVGDDNLSTRGGNKIRERVHSILAEVGLAGCEKQFPFQLSGGMKQRAALARALVSGAPVLLMDEPFGSLDALRREELQGLLLRMWAEHGLSVVFVTHDIIEALLLADTVLVLGAEDSRGAEDARDTATEHERQTGEKFPSEKGISLREIPIDLARPRSSAEPRFLEYYKKIYNLL